VVTPAVGVPIAHEPHDELKKRVPGATTQYANVILVSA